MRRVVLVGTLASVAAIGILAVGAGGQRPAGPRVLVFTKTAGFRHASIPAAVNAIRERGTRSGLTVVATEDASDFTDATLARYDAVVFLLTTGDVLNPAQQAAFERFVRRGGGYAGVHSASDTEYDWPWYGRLVGAYFRSHPQIQTARARIEVARDPSTAGLPRVWTRVDEWYNLARNPRGSVRVLATLDESSYTPGPGAMGADHPIAWAHSLEGGRAWYTAGGHTEESYSDPLFLRHVIGGIRYAAGLSPPRIGRITTAVRERRVVAAVRYSTCQPCRGRLVVGGRAADLRLTGGVGRATSPRQRPGRRVISVVLEDPLTRITASARRVVVIR